MPVILDSSEIKVIDGDKNFTIETVKSNVIVNQDTEINEPTITAPDVYVVKTAPIIEDYPVLEADSTNLIAHYKFDGDFTDSSGNGNTLTIGNGTPTTSSTEYKIGESANFLSNDSYLKTSSVSLANKAFSVSVWIKTTSISSNTYFISQGTQPTQRQHLHIGLVYNSGNIKYVNDFWGDSLTSSGTYASDLNNWIHLVYIVESNYNRKIYRNGVLIASDTNTDAFTSTADLKIGTRFNTLHGYYDYTGYLDDLRIYDKALSAEEIDILFNDKVKLEITPVPLQQYTEERMYPPTRDLASASHLISGESYGNGVYETSESDKYGTTLHGYSAFNTSMDTGPHFNNKYTNGVYNGSDYIVPGYLGDWIKIKLPRPIKLTRYGFKQRLNYLIRAPGKYKLYGSNDGTNWDVLVHKITTVSYTQQISFANDYFEENINVNNQYQYFGLVANELNGNDTILNFDEWYIYGKEFISEEPEYKTLTFEYQPTDLIFTFREDESPYSWQEAYDEAIANGKRMSTKTELLNYLASQGNQPLYQEDVWCPVVAPEYSNGKDWIHIGNHGVINSGGHFVGKSHTQYYGYPSWGDNTTFSGARIYCEVIEYNQTEYTVNFTEDTECDILIVGGGGGGGGGKNNGHTSYLIGGGGGGGGGLIFLENQIISANTYIIKVGKGGSGGGSQEKGINGYNSSFSYLQTEAQGGGGGGGYGGDINGNSGGSGGGATWGTASGGTGYVSNLLKNDGSIIEENYRQGYDGGSTTSSTSTNNDAPYTGGGGGASQNGYTNTALSTQDYDAYGGNGRLFTIFNNNGEYFNGTTNIKGNTGTSTYPNINQGWYFAGGGSGSVNIGMNNAGFSKIYGGAGGGGDSEYQTTPSNGLNGTGGGGGGGVTLSNGGHIRAGNGGSGIVIIRYKTQYQATTHGAQWTYHSANPNTHHYGNVGIGTTASATQKLLVNGDMNVTGNYKQNDNTIGNWYKDGTSIYRTSGNVGIGNTAPQYSLHVHGGVYAGQGGTTGDGTTVWTSTSDSRMKDNIFKASYKECYDIFKKIELYRYNFKPGHVNSNDRNQLGFIAQEVQQQIPNSVEPRSIRLSSGVYIHDILTLNVTQINYILYGTFKYLIAELDIIKKHLESQEEAGQTE